MKNINLIMIFFITLIFSLPALADSAQDKRTKIDKRRVEVLSELYSRQPSAKKAVQDAAGHAVFSNFGMKIFLLGGGKGSGVAINNQTNKRTYMKMLELQAGLGMGVKKFSLVWVFENISDFNSFINSGWELSAQTTAAATLDNKGGDFAGAMSVKPGVWVYQLTEDGLALELTGKGTKYYKDGDLN